MKIFTIIGGINGVGKSSYTGAIKNKDTNLGVIINPYEITKAHQLSELRGGKAAVSLGNYCLAKGITFTQESTLSGRRIKRMAKDASSAGYYVRLFYIGLDNAAESVSRIAHRVRKGGHHIDTDKVEARFEKRWSDVAAILPYCNRAEFYDNENGFEFVAHYESGELFVYKKNPPRWIGELEEYLAKNKYTF